MKDIEEKRKQNMKIYALYRMLSADHVFFYAIDFLFLTQVKNISASEIVLSQSFYALFMVILQLFALIIIDKLGNRISMFLSNTFIAIHVLLIMNCKDIKVLILAQFMDAIGFSIKDTADNSLLNFSIPEGAKKGELFSKIEGKGTRNFYYFSAFSAIIAGFLYKINVYIPLIFSFLTSALSAFICLGFEEIKEKSEYKEQIKISTYFSNLKNSFKFIFRSERLKALLLYSGFFSGIYFLMNTYITSLLEEIGAVSTVIAGYTFLKSIASGIGSKKQLEFHNQFRNSTLSKILISTLISIWAIGIVGIIRGNFIVSIILITMSSLIMFFLKGIHDVLTVRYLQNFTNEKILSKIYSVNSFFRNFCRIIIGLIGAYFLKITNTANSIILIGIIFAIITFVLIVYMKKRVGLKPEEYDVSEINFDE